MSKDFGSARSAESYARLYHEMLGRSFSPRLGNIETRQREEAVR
jgi:hypothetical protein